MDVQALYLCETQQIFASNVLIMLCSECCIICGAGTYSAVDHIHINVSLLGPFVPEVGVIQRDVCAVSGRHKTGLKADIRII